MTQYLKEKIEEELKEVDIRIHRYHYIGWKYDHLFQWRHFLLEGLLCIQLKEFNRE